jgi:DNA primase
MVSAAVATGNISTEELSEMLKLNGDPEAQSNYAAKIVARTNAADRALQQQYQRTQIASLQASIESKNATTTTGKPLTAAQYTVLNYGTRMQQSNTVIDAIGGKMASPWQSLARRLPNALKTPDQQKFEQAERDFINSVLRRESGAAIADSEFDSARKQYFPQPGDGEAVLAQKALNRNLVIKNFLNEAGQDTTPQDMVISDPLGLGVGAGAAANPLGL